MKPRVEVEVRLDFLSLNAAEEPRRPDPVAQSSRLSKPKLQINIPREVATYSEYDEEEAAPKLEVKGASAYLPFNYITESQHRVEIYRKIAQANDKPSLDRLKGELRDRFGLLPPPTELLLQLSELKILAAGKGITAIESKDDKLMLTRNNDLIQIGGKFPRLTKREAKARLNEIKKLLLAI